jgi:hypothetical protein
MKPVLNLGAWCHLNGAAGGRDFASASRFVVRNAQVTSLPAINLREPRARRVSGANELFHRTSVSSSR